MSLLNFTQHLDKNSSRPLRKFFTVIFSVTVFFCFAFSAFMLLVGWQEGHLACKKTEWWGAGLLQYNPDWFYLSGTGSPG